MNRNLFNYKTIILALITIVFTIVAHFIFFDLVYDSYCIGYRYWVLKVEMIVYPLYFVIAITHLSLKLKKERVVDWSSVKLIAKYLGFLFIFLIVFFILGMVFNDITAKGANINF